MRLTRRQAFLGVAAAGAGGAALAVVVSLRPEGPRDERWLRIVRQTRDFEAAAARRGFNGGWDRPRPTTFEILRPAPETEVVRVEEQIGRTLPSSLRSFFLQCAAAIDVSWWLPGRPYTASWGGMEVRYDLVPPPPFSDERRSPRFNRGGISIRLDRVADLWTGRDMWRNMLLEEEATDDATRAHHEVFARFWERCFPIATNAGGDVVGIDMADPQERLFLAFHDRADLPGWLLGQDLLGHLDQQSRLGFPNFETDILPLFNNRAWSDETFRSFDAAYPDRETVRRFGLNPVGSVSIDSRGPNGLAWRSWVGLPD